MEDKVCVLPFVNEFMALEESCAPITFCGVFDGHNGGIAADYTKVHLYNNIIHHPHFSTNPQEAIKDGFLKTDRDFIKFGSKNGDKSGATATIVLILGDVLYCANVGDSSAMLAYSKDEDPVHMTEEHKASNEVEKKRVKDGGGLVVWFGGGWRVNGTMAVSRSIGDESVGKVMIAEPYIFQHKITESDEYLVIATDGLWDVMNDVQTRNFIHNWMKENPMEGESEESCAYSKNISIALTEEATRLNSGDNITVCVLFLKAKGKGLRRDLLSMFNSDEVNQNSFARQFISE